MELNTTQETASCVATQDLPIILWNWKVRYFIHKSPPLVPIPSLTNPVHSTPSFPRSILILSTHLHIGIPSGRFPCDIPTNKIGVFLLTIRAM
jgi:hypothetical protein